jgi:hypothetical protein
MKWRHAFALLIVSAIPLGAASLDGDITLKYDEAAFGKHQFEKEFGDVVKATTQWRVGDSFGKETVFAGATVKNTGTKPMFFQYYVAFYDKDRKLIGAAGQSSFGDDGLKPGEETQLGSCLVYLPKGKYKEIVSFQAVLWESDQPPKKK